MVARAQAGSLLLAVLVVLVFLASLGASLLGYVQSRRITVQLELDRLQALYLAEAGIARAIHEMRLDADLDGNGLGNVGITTLATGRFRARHNFQTSTITGIGESNGVQRTVEIVYNAL